MAERDARQVVFLDESSANVTLTPRYARAPRNERALGRVPRNYDRNTTRVAALTPLGLIAPMTLPGALNSDAFAAYLQQLLVPVLRPDQVIICDNLSVHKHADIRRLIEAVGGERCFLPAYSPDFNPSALAFSKLKARLRRAQARTQDTVEEAIAAALDTITAADASHWFQHAGYDLPRQAL